MSIHMMASSAAARYLHMSTWKPQSGMHDLPWHAHFVQHILSSLHVQIKLTRHNIFRAAQVDDQVAADAPQAGLQVEHGLQEELGAEGSGLGVPEGRQLVLPRVKAVQRHNLHTAVMPNRVMLLYNVEQVPR